jgi:hypothetical protein
MSQQQNNPQQTIERLWPQLVASPELHLHQLDFIQQAALFVRMPEGAYRQASFLDGRSFTPQTEATWIPFQRVYDSVLSAPVPAHPLHFIFHMGHTGSTLLSRLLDETGVVQGLREPLTLRELAAMHDQNGDPASLVSPEALEQWTEILLRLWSRCREGKDCAVVKATSTAARLGETLMKARPRARAVYLSMAPEPYLAVILGGPSSQVDIRGHAEERMRRLMGYLGEPLTPLHALGQGGMAAIAWITEALCRERLRKSVGERLMRVDFDELLVNVAGTMEGVLAHLEITGGEDLAANIASSPVLGQYAKAPEHGYSADLRKQVMADSRHRNSLEIERGMNLVENLARSHEEVARLLQASS